MAAFLGFSFLRGFAAGFGCDVLVMVCGVGVAAFIEGSVFVVLGDAVCGCADVCVEVVGVASFCERGLLGVLNLKGVDAVAVFLSGLNDSGLAGFDRCGSEYVVHFFSADELSLSEDSPEADAEEEMLLKTRGVITTAGCCWMVCINLLEDLARVRVTWDCLIVVIVRNVGL